MFKVVKEYGCQMSNNYDCHLKLASRAFKNKYVLQIVNIEVIIDVKEQIILPNVKYLYLSLNTS